MGHQYGYLLFATTVSPNAEKYIDELLKNEQPVISAITEIELRCWKTANEKDLEILNSFIADALVIELGQAIKLKAAQLRKAYKIKLPDAIIASTALVDNLILLSRNLSDFGGIHELRVISPWNGKNLSLN